MASEVRADELADLLAGGGFDIQGFLHLGRRLLRSSHFSRGKFRPVLNRGEYPSCACSRLTRPIVMKAPKE